MLQGVDKLLNAYSVIAIEIYDFVIWRWLHSRKDVEDDDSVSQFKIARVSGTISI